MASEQSEDENIVCSW